MSAMRSSTKIPMNFTMEFLEEQILSIAENNQVMILLVPELLSRNDGGYYLPQNNSVSYLIHAVGLENKAYTIENKRYEVDLYKDFYITKQLLSSVKTTNKIINITGSIYANENGLDNCLLLNDSKNVEALQEISLCYKAINL
jgi:branched-chain amino acid aminotransferase